MVLVTFFCCGVVLFPWQEISMKNNSSLGPMHSSIEHNLIINWLCDRTVSMADHMTVLGLCRQNHTNTQQRGAAATVQVSQLLIVDSLSTRFQTIVRWDVCFEWENPTWVFILLVFSEGQLRPFVASQTGGLDGQLVVPIFSKHAPIRCLTVCQYLQLMHRQQLFIVVLTKDSSCLASSDKSLSHL